MDEREISVTVRIAMISDGTQGISLSAPDRVLGEWQDSGAALLRLNDDNAISICSADGNRRYGLSLPGTVVRCDLLSDTEVVMVIKI